MIMRRNVLMLIGMLIACTASARKALVVIAHGAPDSSWNAPVLALQQKLQKVNIPGIDYRRVALMEFAHPNITDVVADCERQGIDTVFAMPLFMAPSGHSDDDVPNILGIRYNPATRKSLAEEGAKTVRSDMHFIEGPTLHEGDVVEKAMFARIKEMSKDPRNEAVVLLAHGDPYRIGFWNSLLARTRDYVKQQTGIDFFEARLIAMGQYFDKDVKPLLEKAAKTKRRILVQGLYLMSSTSDMAKMFNMDQKAYMESLGAEVIYGKAGVLPESSDLVVTWITETTRGWLATLNSVH